MDSSETSLKTAAIFSLIILGVAVTFFILKILQDIFIPFVVAYLLYFIFLPLNRYLQKRKLPLWSAIIIDILIMVLLIGGVSSLVIGTFYSFADQMPMYAEKLGRTISNFVSSLGIKDPSLQNFQIKDLAKQIDLKMIAGGAFTSTMSFLGNFMIMILFFAFIVSGHPVIYNALKKRFTPGNKDEDSRSDEPVDESQPQKGTRTNTVINKGRKKSFAETFQEVTDQVQKYFISKVIISLITAFLEGLTIFLFGVDFAIIWAVLIFFLNFIPGIGSLIALSLPCLLAVVQLDSITMVILLIATLIVLDTILGNIVEPLMFGDTMNMTPLVILFSLLIWGYVWGFIGALLSVPIMAVFKIIISKSSQPDLVFINNLMDPGSKQKSSTVK